jgi:transposase
MLKIVHPICCGIDVHKTFVVATIAATDKKSITTYITQRFSTFTRDLKALAQWLSDQSCLHVCMESTGKYWIPVYNVLEPSCRITLAHPKYVKAIRGKKTDKKDSVWIADLFKHDLVPGSFIPEKQIRDLREIMRYRCKLVGFTSSEKNRLQNALTISNIQLASVVSDTFGKSSKAIIAHLLENPGDPTFDFRPLLHGSMRKNEEQIALAIEGTVTPVQASKIMTCQQHVDQLSQYIAHLESLADTLAEPFSSLLLILESVPGVSHVSALVILSEIGPDMSQFKSAKHLCSWAGLAPSNDQSAGKKKSTKISRAGVYIKPVLIQCALASICDKSFPHYHQRYESLKHRRGHKKALIAIARMMLTAIFVMLTNGEMFNPKMYEDSLRKPAYILSPELQLEHLAKRLGYSVVKVPDLAE